MPSTNSSKDGQTVFHIINMICKIKSYLLCWITVAQLLRFTCYFYWLANSASELEEKSKVFCKLPKRMYFNKGSSYANFGKDIAAVKLGKLWGDENSHDSRRFMSLDPITIGNSVLDLNLRLLLSMIAAIVTYLVIIVQFQAIDMA
ncbi:putative gustatory receptor 23a, isoform B [Folsomia candida]|uniref:Putative gustatory receptor 23a, isoform B n=1 Tax=Folsomia candida TaxID=158441 RepID=A0A226EPA2_FOLCA|nr:putative gustatory receptor 23a, isoform B [Folsomia candida]